MNSLVTTTKDVELYFDERCADSDAVLMAGKNAHLDKSPFAIVNLKGDFVLLNKYELLSTVKKNLDFIISIHFLYDYPHGVKTVTRQVQMKPASSKWIIMDPISESTSFQTPSNNSIVHKRIHSATLRTVVTETPAIFEYFILAYSVESNYEYFHLI